MYRKDGRIAPYEKATVAEPFVYQSVLTLKAGAFHGGINAQLWDDIELVKAEMERIIPAMKEGGGYVFASDHSIPNSVSFGNMKQIAELARKLGAY